jgi:hypothetical protein
VSFKCRVISFVNRDGLTSFFLSYLYPFISLALLL